MNILAVLIFYGWFPAIFALFAAMPPRRAVIVSYLIGWLFIPPAALPLPGLPDYTKVTATTIGVLMAALLFDARSFQVLRPRLCDLPALAWCVAPFFSSISNGLGAYDGMSESFGQVVTWGFPYIVGRAYFADLEGLREIAVAIVISGLVQVPLCLYELRMSPRLMQDVFGIGNWEGALRFGAYRPRAFMFNGLSLGMWMTVSSLVGYWLWATGVMKRLGGYPFSWWLLLLVTTTVLCRSSGALILLAAGALAMTVATRKRGRPWIVWAMMASVPLYCATRATGAWTGENAVELTRTTLGEDRAQSLEFRFFNEDVIAERALTQPLFGWGGWDRLRSWNPKTGRITVPDGLWVIALSQNGIFGLTSLTLLLLLPPALLLIRFPVRSWRDPALAPAGALAMVNLIATIDDLSNAQIIPIYTLFGAGVMTLRPSAARRAAPGAAERPARGPSDPRGEAVAGHARRAEALAEAGRWEEALVESRRALDLGEAIDPAREGGGAELAALYQAHARILDRLGRRGESLAARRRAVQAWPAAGGAPADPSLRRRRAECLNDLAWALAVPPDAAASDAQAAARLAREAIDLEPGDATFWNTLGAARYRAGDLPGAAEALERAMALADAPHAFDLYLMAMVVARRGDAERAGALLARGDAAGGADPGHASLARLRAEAEAALGRGVAP